VFCDLRNGDGVHNYPIECFLIQLQFQLAVTTELLLSLLWPRTSLEAFGCEATAVVVRGVTLSLSPMLFLS